MTGTVRTVAHVTHTAHYAQHNQRGAASRRGTARQHRAERSRSLDHDSTAYLGYLVDIAPQAVAVPRKQRRHADEGPRCDVPVVAKQLRKRGIRQYADEEGHVPETAGRSVREGFLPSWSPRIQPQPNPTTQSSSPSLNITHTAMSLITMPSLFSTDPFFNDFFGLATRRPTATSLVAMLSPFNATSMRCDLVEVRDVCVACEATVRLMRAAYN